ncbi:hypothetical protein PtA15_8A211 [Puccinia triticina]|uniref:Uncharacterized protein n=1 Tax=Puccinia triticina TaxID=208348 RepID=A0ABY7CS50_9BASI|nr:uncharacterized protein PtA15_8A211 [Puccinia triticina]WAQ87307.1 hypothetical protein PtA15_8A211 [Puccinia triticina]WAR57161.1 hypothetical protein PtB15_8B208 [Puccinia triticina]
MLFSYTHPPPTQTGEWANVVMEAIFASSGPDGPQLRYLLGFQRKIESCVCGLFALLLDRQPATSLTDVCLAIDFLTLRGTSTPEPIWTRTHALILDTITGTQVPSDTTIAQALRLDFFSWRSANSLPIIPWVPIGRGGYMKPAEVLSYQEYIAGKER